MRRHWGSTAFLAIGIGALVFSDVLAAPPPQTSADAKKADKDAKKS